LWLETMIRFARPQFKITDFFTLPQLSAMGVKMVGVAGGALVTKGVMTSDQVSFAETAFPVVFGLIGIGLVIAYSLWANRRAKLVAMVAASPTERVVTTDVELASKVESLDPKATITVSGELR
jgi:hypothetical protein